MAAPLLLSVKDASVRYSDQPIFENLSFNIHKGTRIALVGKNGAGKSTLMNIITGLQDLDAGERWEEAGTTCGYLKQEVLPQEGQTVYDYVIQEIDKAERELHAYKVDIVTDALQLDPQALLTQLSGGQLRRAGLARALVEEPDILLLDEPTNHLDLQVIEWLEGYLKNYRGTLLVVSHDRAFLANITTQVFWLDRGQIKVSPRGFAYFDEWSTLLLEQEERELKNRKTQVAQEVEWASRGVKARRKRNIRRLEQMKVMRDQFKADESAYRRATATIKVTAPKGIEENSKIVAEFYNVHKAFEDKIILDGFSLRISRGERIGVLGRNGSGKTTFLRLLVGEEEPDQGNVKRKKDLEFSYFDQKRSDLNMDDTLRKVLAPSGGDYINVMGKDRHVCGYLKDFMFDPSRAFDKVSTLSGGQKNRLMLAKILANPQSCLILDEPTNDLDMETLDMLEEILSQYQGTLLVVSHDRDFLDQTVTRILAFEGDGVVDTCIGGYSDYLAMKKGQDKSAPARHSGEGRNPKGEAAKDPGLRRDDNSKEKPQAPKAPAVKMTYKLEKELSDLPDKIKVIEKAIADLTTVLGDAGFYQRDPDGFHLRTKQLAELQAKLERYETRWLDLEEQRASAG